MEQGHFPATRRLRDRAAFQRVFQRPVKVSAGVLTLYARPNGLDHARLGLAISRKACRLAVDRNRIKRVVRESFRRHQQILGGVDIIVMARPGVAGHDNRQLFTILDETWPRLVERCVNSSSA